DRLNSSVRQTDLGIKRNGSDVFEIERFGNAFTTETNYRTSYRLYALNQSLSNITNDVRNSLSDGSDEITILENTDAYNKSNETINKYFDINDPIDAGFLSGLT